VPSIERRRREDRDAESAEEGWVLGEGVPLPSRLGGLEERREPVSSPSGVRGGAPAANAF